MNRLLRSVCAGWICLWMAAIPGLAQSRGALVPDADTTLARAVAAARTGDISNSRALLERGARQFPADPRFSVELAGIAFLQQRYPEAKRLLRHARHLGSTDPYVAEFLGTLYLLDGNVEAALAVQSASGGPVLVNDQIATGLENVTDAGLASGAASFRPNATLTQRDFLLTERTVSLLGVCGSHTVDLSAERDARYRARIRCVERPAFGENRVATLLTLGRGLAYQGVHLRFPNLRRSAWNWDSLFRWDARKRRIWTKTSLPLAGRSRWRFEMDADARDEQWQVLTADTQTVAQTFRHRRAEAGVAVAAVLGPRATWSNRLSLANRWFSNAHAAESTGLPDARLREGSSVRYAHRLDADIFRNPMRRIFVKSVAEASAERYFAARETVIRTEGTVRAEWFPKASGTDYRTTLQVTAGALRGTPALTEHFTAGLERDSLDAPGSALLRAHTGTRDGRKGSLLFGNRMAGANLEMRKELLRLGVLTVAVAPFLDAAWVRDPMELYGARQMRFDAGLQGIAVLAGGTELRVSYAWDLRNGRRAFYAWSQPFP